MTEIELDVLWHTDGTKVLDECGLEYDIEEVETRKVIFYGISHIAINKWDDTHEFTNIFALSGEQYISPLKYNELKKVINYQIINSR